jgi:hypothetical protein
LIISADYAVNYGAKDGMGSAIFLMGLGGSSLGEDRGIEFESG